MNPNRSTNHHSKLHVNDSYQNIKDINMLKIDVLIFVRIKELLRFLQLYLTISRIIIISLKSVKQFYMSKLTNIGICCRRTDRRIDFEYRKA